MVETSPNRNLQFSTNVLIDTSEFIRLRYDFDGELLQLISSLCQKQRAKILLPRPVYEEIKSNIREDVKSAQQEIRKVSRRSAMFRNALPELYQILNQGIDYEQVSRSLETALDNYIAQSGAVVLGYEFADVGNVFSRYFSKSAPFGDGKRKHEFPDAFAIQMVEHWCRAENARAYVITSDKAIKEVCESNEFVQHLERIDQFLDISNRQDTAIAELVDRYIEDHPDEISDLAAEKFEELSFYVEDEDGSVDGVSVSTALCLSYSILSYTSTNVRVFTEFQIEYASHISYPDPDFTWYDSETGRVHHLEYLSEEVLRIEWVECEFVLGIDQDSGIGIGARDLIVISPKSIGVTTEQQEEAASNYK